MVLDEKLRWYGFWAADCLKGGKVRKYYQEIRESYKRGTSVAKTEEKIRKLIAHAVRTRFGQPRHVYQRFHRNALCHDPEQK